MSQECDMAKYFTYRVENKLFTTIGRVIWQDILLLKFTFTRLWLIKIN